MSEGHPNGRKWWIAGFWFAIALAGILFFSFYIGLHERAWLPIVIFSPTSTIGMGGAIGSLYGKTMRGVLFALLAECVFISLGLILAFSGFEF
jgi:hypothetical protein